MQTDSKLTEIMSRRTQALTAIISLLLLVTLAYDSIGQMFFRWWHEEEYSYGLLSAAFTLWLISKFWQEYQTRLGGNGLFWLGSTTFFIGSISILIGNLVASHFLSQTGFMLGALALVWLHFDRSIAKLSAGLAGILILAIPLPYHLQVSISGQLQHLSSMLGTELLKLLQIPVFRSGNLIDLGLYKLQVVEACSGLQYLFSMICFAFIAAFFYFRGPWWAKGLILLSAAPLSVILNAFRISSTGVLVKYHGTTAAEGFLHYFQGWVVFLAGLLLLLAFVSLLQYLFRNSSQPTLLSNELSPQQTTAGKTITKKALLIAPLGIVAIIVGLQTLATSNLSSQVSSFDSFAFNSSQFAIKRKSLSQAEIDTLRPSYHFIADVISLRDQKTSELYMLNYAEMSKGFSIHSPSVCLLGSGWEVEKMEEKALHFGAQTITLNQMVIMRDGRRQILLFWYQQQGRVITNKFELKLRMLLGTMIHRRSDAGFARISTPIYPDESEQQASQRLQGTLAQYFLEIYQHLPAPN